MDSDAGYQCFQFLVVPYIHPAAAIPENYVFNQVFSSARVTIEHVNGVKVKQDFRVVNKWIIVCLLVHNILQSYNDEWEYDDSDDEMDADEHGNMVWTRDKLL
jgi:hypothetical protein